jgi:hypothetical protein
MSGGWERKRVLVWGKTRPEVSQTYREIVCTGGVFEDTKKLVRLYPVPMRYMDDETVFKKYQWIEAQVAKPPNDPRPESYRIKYDDIKVLGSIPTEKGNWDARAEWILQPQNLFQSVEELQESQRQFRTSLGLVEPGNIVGVRADRFSHSERVKYLQNYEEVTRQLDLPLDPDNGREIKPLKPPDYRFKAKFRCDDPRCSQDHEFSILDWEVDALYFRLRQQGGTPEEAAAKVVDRLQDEVLASDKDCRFFLGNISTHPSVFTIVGLWYPKKKPQPSLFE